MRVVFCNEEEGLELLGRSTAYVERAYLTMRLFNDRLARNWTVKELLLTVVIPVDT